MTTQIRVLIVDDHKIVRQSMKALLDEFGDFQIIGEAANGVKAVELVDRLKPDVVLMDLLMPVMDGIEAIKHIRMAHPDQRIIALTASYSDDVLVQAMEAGATGYIRKDAYPDELIQLIYKINEREPLDACVECI
jgi:two-component system, NarL family, response regulator LiaR